MKKKYYMSEKGGIKMKGNKIFNKINLSEKNLGFVLWQLNEIENFYPCYKAMIKKW